MQQMHSHGASIERATFEYGFEKKATSSDDPSRFVVSRPLDVEPGRYQVTPELTVDVFGGGVGRVKMGDHPFEPLQFDEGNFVADVFEAGTYHPSTFQMTTDGTISVVGHNRKIRGVQLGPAMRINV